MLFRKEVGWHTSAVVSWMVLDNRALSVAVYVSPFFNIALLTGHRNRAQMRVP